MGNRIFVDQIGRSVFVPAYPKRIVSLVPSITELLFDMGLGDNVVGVTKFCIHPANELITKTKIGGTKNLKLDLIKDLNPCLIIGNKEENVKDQILELEKIFPVWMSDCNSFEEGLAMILAIGELCGVEELTEKLTSKIQNAYSELNVGQGKSFIYFIWNEPKYIVGKGTFINSMLEKIGFVNSCNVFRYPVWNGEDADIVFLSSEPFPFKMEDVKQYAELFPNSKIIIIDGEMCSWYGSRMILAEKYFRKKYFLI
jgi:ABC-type Fe3+-hydroxamate transport system substrate-binding protein